MSCKCNGKCHEKGKKLKNRKQIINGVERLPLEIQMTIK